MAAVAVLCALLLGACDEGPGGPSAEPLFGQMGEIVVRSSTPMAGGEGQLDQTLRWVSNGAWAFQERISYRGLPGDETVSRSRGNPSALAREYQQFVTQLHQTRGLQLFIPELDPNLEPECSPGESRFSVTLSDRRSEEEREWVRCADGGIFTATPGGAGPDPAATRVVVAGELTRLLTLGAQAQSAYRGSVPFGTLDQGENSPTELEGPRAFLVPEGGTPSPPSPWLDFWARHAGPDEPPPEVDWSREMVLVASVGPREEAGDSVEVRRILQVADGTDVELVERRPGDFCSPAPRRQYPYHVVVAPRTRQEVRFADVRVERVPCGI